jgi:hypothetical protein
LSADNLDAIPSVSSLRARISATRRASSFALRALFWASRRAFVSSAVSSARDSGRGSAGARAGDLDVGAFLEDDDGCDSGNWGGAVGGVV